MTTAGETPFSKADVERLVADIVPPIVEKTVASAMTKLNETMVEKIACGVTRAMNEQNRALGMDTTTAAGVREIQTRNFHLDAWIKSWPDVQRRWNAVDECLRDLTPEDRAWVREARHRSERDANTLRETVIRWLVPAILGAILAAGFAWMREDHHAPVAAQVAAAAVPERRDPAPTPLPTPASH